MMEQSMQEKIWAGPMGDAWYDRNSSPELVASNIAMFSRMLQRAQKPESICELGAGHGMNMIAIHAILPHCKLTGIEVNKKAAKMLANLPYVDAKCCSIYETPPTPGGGCTQYDLVFTRGVLICQNPDWVSKAYDVLYNSSKRYILLCEYYNPTPVEIDWRGSKLFKRDFAGEMLTRYPDLQLLDYGFIYHRDYNFPQDDYNWFLMEKR